MSEIEETVKRAIRSSIHENRTVEISTGTPKEWEAYTEVLWAECDDYADENDGSRRDYWGLDEARDGSGLHNPWRIRLRYLENPNYEGNRP